VEDGVAAGYGAPQPTGIEEIDPVVADVGAELAQLARDVAADEPACARDIDAHRSHDCGMRRLPPGPVTLLFTDIDGSTRLLHELGQEAYAAALAEHRRVLRDACGANGGVEVDTQGDAFFVAFPTAEGAVAAAAEAQTALATGPVLVRMGLHTGTPHVTAEGYVGEDVHLGARVAASGHGGQVLLSKATRELLDGAELRDLGEHRLKDFEQPVWIYQLGDEPFPPLKTISNTNLPRPASSFVGREREVGEVAGLLREGSRLVILTGPGGSGKTRLGIEAAAELVGEFRNGVFWVGLATVRDPELVQPTIAQTLGAQEELPLHIGDKEMLLLLDNLEQVVEAGLGLAGLVEACPHLRLIVTSRELLRVRGEVEYEVLPLADPDAVQLFCERGGLRPSPAVEELCRRLDNMPLALELAAARVKVLSPEQIVERLSERLDLFKGGRDADPRQQSLRATIEWSYDLLTQVEQEVFRRLGVFAGGCTLDTSGAVAGADLDTLQSLVEKSLVRHTDDRFWMLETIREYALARLDELDESEAIMRRHAKYFAAVAESARLSVESIAAGCGTHGYALVEREQANIRAALDWLQGAGETELGMRAAVELEQYWVTNGPAEGTRRLTELLEHGSEVPAELRVRAIRSLAGSTYIMGEFEEGTRRIEQAMGEYERLGDDWGVAHMKFRLAVEANRTGDPERARSLCEESLALHSDTFSVSQASTLLGAIAFDAGRHDEALELLERSARLAGEIDFTWWRTNALQHAAEFALALGRVDDARPFARESLELARAISDRQGIAYGLTSLAWLAALTGQAQRSGMLWGAVEAEAERGQIGQWEDEREEYAAHLAPVAGPEFERARAEGRALSFDEAVDYALGKSNA
jgi:predicted ATPase/class 3 adenylate cyclase